VECIELIIDETGDAVELKILVAGCPDKGKQQTVIRSELQLMRAMYKSRAVHHVHLPLLKSADAPTEQVTARVAQIYV
jgi:hypothetical protein